MRALVLVGGQGTRLRPLTLEVPKQMLPIVGRPMIARVLEWLARAEIEEAVLSLGYRPDTFVDAFPTGEWAGVRLSYAVEPTPLDTAGAIRFAAIESGMSEERIVVVNGDVLTDLDLLELIDAHDSHGGSATISLTPVEDPSAYGVVPTEDDGAVSAFIEKPPPGTAPTHNINAGTYILEALAISQIPKEGPSSIERLIFPRLVEQGELYAFASDAYWIDTGTPHAYIRAQVDVVAGRRSGIELDGVVVEGDCVLAPGARRSGAVDSTYLGPDVRVDDGAVVERSILGTDSVVESGAVVRDSVLLPGAVVRGGATVISGIVGWDATVSAGASVVNAGIVARGVVLRSGETVDGAQLDV